MAKTEKYLCHICIVCGFVVAARTIWVWKHCIVQKRYQPNGQHPKPQLLLRFLLFRAICMQRGTRLALLPFPRNQSTNDVFSLCLRTSCKVKCFARLFFFVWFSDNKSFTAKKMSALDLTTPLLHVSVEHCKNTRHRQSTLSQFNNFTFCAKKSCPKGQDFCIRC